MMTILKHCLIAVTSCLIVCLWADSILSVGPRKTVEVTLEDFPPERPETEPAEAEAVEYPDSGESSIADADKEQPKATSVAASSATQPSEVPSPVETAASELAELPFSETDEQSPAPAIPLPPAEVSDRWTDFEFGSEDAKGAQPAFVGVGHGNAGSETGAPGLMWSVRFPADIPWDRLEESPSCRLVAYRVTQQQVQVAEIRNERLMPVMPLAEFIRQNAQFAGRHGINPDRRLSAKFLEPLMSHGGGWKLRLMVCDTAYHSWSQRIRDRIAAHGRQEADVHRIYARLDFQLHNDQPQLLVTQLEFRPVPINEPNPEGQDVDVHHAETIP